MAGCADRVGGDRVGGWPASLTRRWAASCEAAEACGRPSDRRSEVRCRWAAGHVAAVSGRDDARGPPGHRRGGRPRSRAPRPAGPHRTVTSDRRGRTAEHRRAPGRGSDQPGGGGARAGGRRGSPLVRSRPRSGCSSRPSTATSPRRRAGWAWTADWLRRRGWNRFDQAQRRTCGRSRSLPTGRGERGRGTAGRRCGPLQGRPCSCDQRTTASALVGTPSRWRMSASWRLVDRRERLSSAEAAVTVDPSASRRRRRCWVEVRTGPGDPG